MTGSVLGSVLLLSFPGTAFRRVIPFLILLACALVAFQPVITRRLAAVNKGAEGGARGLRKLGGQSALLVVAVFLTGIYGGYFGAAQGVVLIALLAIFINDQLQRLNAVKNVLALLANFAAGVIFAFSGRVSWEAAAVLAAGAIVGGQVGGRLGRRLPQPILRGP